MEEMIFDVVRNSRTRGLSITDIVKVSGVSRGVVRISLARLEGAGKISYREVGISKVYYAED